MLETYNNYILVHRKGCIPGLDEYPGEFLEQMKYVKFIKNKILIFFQYPFFIIMVKL